MTIRLTVVTSAQPEILSKHFTLSPDGELNRPQPSAQLTRGEVEVVEVPDLAGLAPIIASLKTSQALIYGIPKNPKAKVLVTEAQRKRVPDSIARTSEDFAWPDGPGIWMLDHDPLPGGPVHDRDSLVEALRQAVPELRGVEMLWVPSASSNLCRVADGKDLTGLRGQRLYVAVAQARDIPRAGRVLLDRLWLVGKGVMSISASGAFLARTLFDGSVWQSNRLDFAAGASTGPGLAQRRGVPVLVPQE